ncbi:MAG TPA: type II toxin-antitoxin system RelE/ParE family toxin [Phycisphaerae bacterium]|nr:type II toxin-antitoxin system RelE/ParE family toxin [Phycisphaerae bacterium]
MIRFRVITSPSVEEEINDALVFIAKHSPENALKWANQIEDAILSLKEVPERCPLAPESEEFNVAIRHLVIGNYRVLFTIRGDEVHVLHVRHGARRPIDPLDN